MIVVTFQKVKKIKKQKIGLIFMLSHDHGIVTLILITFVIVKPT